MELSWLVAYLLLAGLAIVPAVLGAVQVYEHRRFARSRFKKLPTYRPTGRAVLLVPCRGRDVGLEENLHTLFVQDYDDYEIRFIVESADDPVYPVIRRVMAEHPEVEARVIVAGRAEVSGQKVHNLRVGTARLPDEVEYLAFVDSDARLRRHWLRALLGRLARPDVAATTGYRWFVPHRPSPANHLLYSINCNFAALSGRKAPSFVWGGSWAIRREMFEWLGIRNAWKGTLSDDLVASRLLHRTKLRVDFEPACMVASPLDATLRETISFLRRQYLIVRFYVPAWWWSAFVLITLSNLALWGSLGLVVWGLATGRPSPWLPAGVGAVLYLFGVFRGLVRQDLALVYFPHLSGALKKARRFDVWAGPLVGVVNWLGLAGSLLGREITWRGITYRLFRGGRIRLVRHEVQAPPPDPEYHEENPAVAFRPGTCAPGTVAPHPEPAIARQN